VEVVIEEGETVIGREICVPAALVVSHKVRNGVPNLLPLVKGVPRSLVSH
jgi:hypothetical protein